jgi:hypothetical protein
LKGVLRPVLGTSAGHKQEVGSRRQQEAAKAAWDSMRKPEKEEEEN